MKFYCTCKHSRGKHEDSTKNEKEVGGCYSCKCNKYDSDKKKNKTSSVRYLKKELRIIVLPIIVMVLLSTTDKWLGISYSAHMMIMAVSFVLFFVYYTMLSPLKQLSNRVFSR